MTNPFIYEPESRVRIQEHKPEEKVSYQVIQSVEINHEDCEQKIKFNSSLNTIIRNIEEKIKANKKSKKELFEKIIQEHIKYKNEIEKLIDKFDLEHEDIKIKITKHFKDDKCREELKSYLTPF